MVRTLYRRIERRLYQSWLALRFRLFDRRRHNRLVVEHVGGIPLVVMPGVFNPALFATAELFLSALEAMQIRPGLRALDLGAGAGLFGIAAARRGAAVTATDLNPIAARCARINAILNDVTMDVRQGDLFEPVAGERFDLVLFTPPMFEGDPEDEMAMAFFARDILDRFFDALAAHLLPGGCALIRASSTASLAACRSAAERNGVSLTTVATRRTPGEVYHVLKAAIP